MKKNYALKLIENISSYFISTKSTLCFSLSMLPFFIWFVIELEIQSVETHLLMVFIHNTLINTSKCVKLICHQIL